jgi:hypothetical protein
VIVVHPISLALFTIVHEKIPADAREDPRFLLVRYYVYENCPVSERCARQQGILLAVQAGQEEQGITLSCVLLFKDLAEARLRKCARRIRVAHNRILY